MRCAICDRQLSVEEIKIDPRYETYDPCGTCLEVIENVFSDPLDEDEITRLLEEEWPEVYEHEANDISNTT